MSLILLAASVAQAQIAVRGQTVYTMDGPVITDGVVVVKDGKISAVGTYGSVRIPDGYEVLEAAVVTPGLVDIHATVGLTGIFNSPATRITWTVPHPSSPSCGPSMPTIPRSRWWPGCVPSG